MAENNPERIKQSMLVIANGVELGARIVGEIMGNDISNSLNGSKVTQGMLNTMIANRIRMRLNQAKYKGAQV